MSDVTSKRRFTEAELNDALSRLTSARWWPDSPVRQRAAFSIPADPEKDADLILSAAIDELIELRASNPTTEPRL